MGFTRMGAPTELVTFVSNLAGISTFIEGGTYTGGTSRWASHHFNTVHTIEAQRSIYQRTKASLAEFKNIKFWNSTTIEALPMILSEIEDTPSTFWLDAHWSGGETYGIDAECPLIDEIEIILKSNLNHIIFIDDARLFLAPPPLPHKKNHWPSINQLFSTLNSHGERYLVILDDVIISTPIQFSEPFGSFVQSYITKTSQQKYRPSRLAGLVKKIFKS